ncbi:hypothetical protein GGF46_005309 [Coemansia sp. RSA 552]|nr:hypothetical protein GGF46_005309 [Coemansia sp. RSA 552]
MPYRDPGFQQACLAWVSVLSGEDVRTLADLVDGRILVGITTAADPEFFAAASLELAGVDALAQLARLLLRYFERERPLQRGSVPGVATLAAAPFDDLWRLVALVVSATLLSERNNAAELYDALDSSTKTRLRQGVSSVWGDGDSRPYPDLIDLEAGPPSAVSVAVSLASQFESAQQSCGATQLFESARSSLQGGSGSQGAAGPQTVQADGPALLQITNDTQSTTLQIPSITQSMADSSGDSEQSAAGGSELDSESGSELETDSYVSEFSQELAAYGAGALGMGFAGLCGPNAVAAYVLIGNMLVYLCVGGYLLATTAAARKSPYFGDYADAATAAGYVVGISAVAAAASVAWVQLLQYQARRVIWMTTLTVPVGGLAAALWAGTQVLWPVGGGGSGEIRMRNALVAAVCLLLAVRFGWTIAQRRRDIERSVGVVQLACRVLAQNRELYAFSLLLLALYGAFSVASAIVATRLVLAPHAWALGAYLALSFAWASAACVQIQRAVVAGVVGQWYFHRHDPGEPPTLRTLQAATVSALSTQLGPVAVASALLFATRTLHVVQLVARWLVRLLRIVPLVGFDYPTGYAAVYAVLTGRGFFESSRAAGNLLRTHHLLHAPAVSLLKSAITGYALLLSVVAGYAVGLRAISVHALLLAAAATAVPFALLQLVTHVVSCTVETLVICYAIDLELGSCHSINVVEALSLV